MAYTTATKVRLLTSITTSDISDVDLGNIILESTKEMNRMMNVQVIREPVFYIDTTRENKVDGSNTNYYIRNWRGKYLADMDNDGDVDTSDVIVYLVDSDGNETTATVSSIDHDDGKITLSSAPSSGTNIYITYEWAYKDVSTPDPLVELACTLLTSAYCYAKLNIGKAVQHSFGGIRLLRHMDSFDHYYKRFLGVMASINDAMAGVADSTETLPGFKS